MAAKRGFFWHLYLCFIIIIFFTILGVAWYGFRSMRAFYLGQVESDLLARAKLAMSAFKQGRYPFEMEQVDAFCDKLGRASSTRITVILPSGRVLGDSEKAPRLMDNHADRPEFIQALSSGFGSSTRYSFTLRKEMMYVAIPLRENGETSAVFRVSLPIRSITSSIGTPLSKVVIGALVFLVGAWIAALVVSWRISVPVKEIHEAADSISSGNLSARAALSGPKEMEDLAKAVNRMAEELGKRLEQVTKQRNQMEAMFSNMMEGVILVDADDKILAANEAACDMLGIERGRLKGGILQEAVRNSIILDLVASVRGKGGRREGETRLRIDGQERVILLKGITIPDVGGQGPHVMLVMNDVTTMRRLEQIRRDFVANISHELKTPITAIKGSVETLQELADQSSPQASIFVDIIRRNSQRLESLVEDILTLSHIEKDELHRELRTDEVRVKEIIQGAVSAQRDVAGQKSMRVNVICPKDLRVMANPSLLQKAIANLLDNAIKYSEAGSEISIEAEGTREEIHVKVKDQGPGIEEHHLPRIFERFYRVERAGEAAKAGTGLGLAIVKHLVQLHGGRVSVESKVGQGSTFVISLPSPREPS